MKAQTQKFFKGYCSKWMSEAYSEPCQTSKMELFAKIVNGQKPFTIFVKHFIWGVWQGSEYAFERDLTLSWRMSLSYRNQSIDLESKPMDWFLYHRDLHHERVKLFTLWIFISKKFFCKWIDKRLNGWFIFPFSSIN